MSRPASTMRIEILKSTVADKRIVRAGTIEDVSDADARLLIQIGKARIAGASDGKPGDELPPDPPTVEAPRRRGRPPKGL